MSKNWIDATKTRKDRLANAVGDQKAREIRDVGYDSKIFKKINSDGTYTERNLNDKGNIIRRPND